MSDWIAAQDPALLDREALVNEIDAIFDAYVQLVGGSTPLIQRISEEDARIRQSPAISSLDRKIEAQEKGIEELRHRIAALESNRRDLMDEFDTLSADCRALCSRINAGQ
jgi:chromosome segregation ATPase